MGAQEGESSGAAAAAGADPAPAARGGLTVDTKVPETEPPPSPNAADAAAHRTLELMDWVYLTLAMILPNVALVVALSSAAWGKEVYNAISLENVSLAGNGLAGLFLLLCALYYVLDCPDWPRLRKIVLFSLAWVVVFAAAFCKGRTYPYLPILVIISHMFLFLGLLRWGYMSALGPFYFYRVIALLALISAFTFFCGFLPWWIENPWNEETRVSMADEMPNVYKYIYASQELNYTFHCSEDADDNLADEASETKGNIKKACENAVTVMFVAWGCPLVSALANIVIAPFAYFASKVHFDMHAKKKRGIERILKRITFSIIVMIMGMYASATAFAGVSLSIGGTLMAFFFSGLILLLVWTYIQDRDIFIKRWEEAQKSALVKFLPDWATIMCQALVVWALNVLIPLAIALDYLRNAWKKVRKNTHTQSEVDPLRRFTEQGYLVFEVVRSWKWVYVLWWVCLIGEVYFLFQVGVAKVTYVFLSWLNDMLADVDFFYVNLISFGVGAVMFLLPPVPGIAVYLFCGVLIPKLAEDIDGIGFEGGIGIAIALCFFLKLTASVGQYMIGYFAGQSLYVQQLVGVDKVFTRAIFQVLDQPGLGIGKVAVLVGGPDWPVSVGCGIARVNIPQMLIGTAPVLGVLAPIVCAGAFLGKVTPGEASPTNLLASSLTAAATIIQVLSGLIAVYYIMEVVVRDGENLSKPRAEHEEVTKLSALKEREAQVYSDLTAWSELGWPYKAWISIAAVFMMISCFVMVFFEERTFEEFSITSRISDPIDSHGLGNNVFNLVKAPLGWVIMAMFLVAAVLHLTFDFVTNCLAQQKVKEMQSEVKETQENGEFELGVVEDASPANDSPQVIGKAEEGQAAPK